MFGRSRHDKRDVNCNPLKSMLWDNQQDGYSTGRFSLMVPILLDVIIAFWFMWLVTTGHDLSKVDFQLLIAIVGGGNVAGGGAYLANKMASKGVQVEAEEGDSEEGDGIEGPVGPIHVEPIPDTPIVDEEESEEESNENEESGEES